MNAKKKRIVIDARMIDASTGFYIQHLLHWINESYSAEFDFRVLVPAKSVSKWSGLYQNLAVSPANEASYSVAEQTSLPARLESHKPDLVHFTMPQQPFLWIKPSVTTIHDLTLVHYDNLDMNKYVYQLKKSVFVSLLKTVVRRSRAIIVPTQYVKDDLAQYMGERYRNKTHVTLEAGDPIDSAPEPIKQLQGKQFLFYVGNAYPYKNIECVIAAYEIFKKDNPSLHLALAGKKDYFYSKHEQYVKNHDIEDVHFLGFISPGEKRWALQQCVAYTSASYSEGFNISQLEAMYEGAPVIISNASCHPEVAGDAALYFNPDKPEELASNVREIMNNPALRSRLVKKGTARVKTFSWRRMANQTMAVYRQALGE